MQRTGWVTALLVLLLIATAVAANYPAADGYVTDTAGMLSSATEQALEQELGSFKAESTIEIAVTTVPSLQGQDANTYAVNLANQWGVGSAQSSNGVIILLAQGERQLAIWFGPGYKQSWGNQTSAAVRNGTMIPLLKKGNPDAAVTQGVAAVLSALRSQGYANKWSSGGAQVPSSVTSAPPAAAVAVPPVRSLDPAQFRQFGLGLAAVLGGLVVLVIALLQLRARRKRAELQAEIDQLTESLTHDLELTPAAEQKLRAGYPETMWGPALRALDPNAMERLLYSSTKGRSLQQLVQQRDGLRMAIGSCERVLELLRRAESAKTEVPRLARELPAEIEATRTALANPDVLPETSAALAPLEARLNELQAAIPSPDSTDTDWAALGDEANKLRADIAELKDKAASDVQQVQQARQTLPQLYQQASEQARILREQNKGRYGDVDTQLSKAEQLLSGYNTNYDSLNARDLMYLYSMITNAHTHIQEAQSTYTGYAQPSSSWSGGSSSWGGSGGGGGFSGGGMSGGSGGSSGW